MQDERRRLGELLCARRRSVGRERCCKRRVDWACRVAGCFAVLARMQDSRRMVREEYDNAQGMLVAVLNNAPSISFGSLAL